ncbi:ABC transporter permease [Streptomyces roseoverticillatus]|uniref:ABC transporter permease n=1 Tax=Streptomyces roseoverticillatus TaxID=66429 RepID=A0ABV3J1P5_9ACTN
MNKHLQRLQRRHQSQPQQIPRPPESPKSGPARHWSLFTTATHYALIEHARNRFATFLAALLVPAVIVLVYVTVRESPVPFVLQSTGRRLSPQGNELTAVTAAVNSVTLITGFMMFGATLLSGDFDRRLAMAGYPRTHLALAKLAALMAAALAVTAYTTGILCTLWTPRQPLQLAAGLLCGGLTYGALGVAFGSLLRKEVEGMFAIALTSVIDTALQNPVSSSDANGSVIHSLPSYGAVQAAVAGSFSEERLPEYLALQLAWFTTAALVSLVAFHRRTRNALRYARAEPKAATA